MEIILSIIITLLIGKLFVQLVRIIFTVGKYRPEYIFVGGLAIIIIVVGIIIFTTGSSNASNSLAETQTLLEQLSK